MWCATGVLGSTTLSRCRTGISTSVAASPAPLNGAAINGYTSSVAISTSAMTLNPGR